jgi:pilus assembly protein FimV
VRIFKNPTSPKAILSPYFDPKSKPRWNALAAAGLAGLLMATASPQALALALGRVNVLSALGEPLRAEIEVPEINADEAATLKATVASPDAFRAAGLEYNAALTGVEVSLQRRANGRAYLRLSSERAITEPFVDLILEANWGAGRIVRDYTMLFDPPNLRQAAPPAPTAPGVSAAPAAPRTAPSTRAPAAPAADAPARPRAPSTATAPRRPAVAKAPTVAAPAPIQGEGGKQVNVKTGDNATRIALANKPATVSLDQMLVAMLRANPDAFMAGNLNRLKAGAVMNMPSEAQATSITPNEASQLVVASSKNFNIFRSSLAQAAPAVGTSAPDRQTSGKVQAQVDEKKPSAAAPDKLTLSKGGVQAKAAEDKIAQERAAKDASTRAAELSKNKSDLDKLAAMAAASGVRPAASGAATGTGTGTGLSVAANAPVVPAAAASAAKPAASAVAVAAAPAPAASATPAAPAAASPTVAATSAATTTSTSAAATPAAASASATDTNTAASTAAPEPAASAPAPAAKVAVAPPPPAPAPSFLEDLTSNPLVPVGGVGVLAALGAWGWYRSRQRKKGAQVDSSFLESRLQPDSFFGASGGQRVDTAEASATGSSMVYSPSQLDAAGDVDPVAEADVYLAYGRDLQAEEILKEAMRTNPSRVAIHLKLMEIYGKRRDARALEVMANEVYALTRAQGPDWDKACEIGRELDPSNPLYQPGGQPANNTGASKAAATGAAAFAVSTQPQSAVGPGTGADSDLDLDLDFSLDEEVVPPSQPAPLSASSATQPLPRAAVAAAASQNVSNDVDFDIEVLRSITTSASNSGATPLASAAPVVAPVAAAIAKSVAAAPAHADSGVIEFDMGALSLDLDKRGPATLQPLDTPITAASDESDDPLQTKLDLAREFQAIGDVDGARALVQEVVSEASGGMKSKAQKLLVELG